MVKSQNNNCIACITGDGLQSSRCRIVESNVSSNFWNFKQMDSLLRNKCLVYDCIQFRLDFGLYTATPLWQKVLTGHHLLWMAKKVIFFLGSTDSQKNRLLWDQ